MNQDRALTYPPRVRIEWMIASARVILALGGVLAAWIEAANVAYGPLRLAVLTAYALYSFAIFALVQTPIEFARGWDVAGYIVDLLVLMMIMATEGATAQFYMYSVFAMISAALRWGPK